MRDARQLVEGYSGNDRDHALELAENVIFMAGKLDEIREQMRDADAIIAYDNGGGQSGTRKNPIFEAYSQLLSSYIKALNALIAMLADSTATPRAKSKLQELRVFERERKSC